MKRMECEICGGNNLIKTDENVFECQACGCKYTLEQAKSLLQEITGTVSVSNIASAENLLVRARRFLDDLDFDSAKEYCNRVLDIDADNQAANEVMQEIMDVIELFDYYEGLVKQINYGWYFSENSTYYDKIVLKSTTPTNYDIKCYEKLKRQEIKDTEITSAILFFLLKHDFKRAKIFANNRFKFITNINFEDGSSNAALLYDKAFKIAIENYHIMNLIKTNLENNDDFLAQCVKVAMIHGVKLALLCGANPNQTIQNCYGEKVTLVKYCKLEGYKDIKQLLIEYGASSGIFG